MRCRIIFIVISYLLLFFNSKAQAQNHKYDLWKTPSFFRGFNVLPIVKHTLKDYNDLKATGANLAQIGIDGFDSVNAPYDINVNAIEATDRMVSFCDSAGIYYTITVRSGPGRRDIAIEIQDNSLKSTIWINQDEQKKYAKMLKDIVDRYKNDSLFVGIGPMVEPNPLFDELNINAKMLKDKLVQDAIDLKSIYEEFVTEIRKADATLPILIQNFQYSCPEFFAVTDTFSDKYIVYEFHSYRPLGYASNTIPNSATYPGDFISVNDLKKIHFDKNVLDSNVFKYVDSVQNATGRPIFLGEFGIEYEQGGGPKFLNDVYEICIEKGWHFALWAFRPGSKDDAWDYELKSPEYWDTVLNMFKKPDYVDDNPNDASAGHLKIFPTLANDKISIHINDEKLLSLKVFDVLGNEVADLSHYFSQAQSEIEYNITSLPNGFYFIRLMSRKGTSVSKFIKLK